MLPAFFLVLREGVEIALIIGIVIGSLRKLDRRDLYPFVWEGAAGAAIVSLLIAAALQFLGTSLEGNSELIFEGMMMLFAAGLLTWMIFWMQTQARLIRNELENDLQLSLLRASRWALISFAFVAVIREGLELAIFFTAAMLASTPMSAISGAFLGLLGAVLLGWAIYFAVIRINLGQFFQVTGVFLILFAAGLVAHAVQALTEAQIIPALVQNVWDLSFVLGNHTTLGSLLGAFFGYNASPSLAELLAYAVYLGGVLLFLNWRRASEWISQKA